MKRFVCKASLVWFPLTLTDLLLLPVPGSQAIPQRPPLCPLAEPHPGMRKATSIDQPAWQELSWSSLHLLSLAAAHASFTPPATPFSFSRSLFPLWGTWHGAARQQTAVPERASTNKARILPLLFLAPLRCTCSSNAVFSWHRGGSLSPSLTMAARWQWLMVVLRPGPGQASPTHSLAGVRAAQHSPQITKIRRQCSIPAAFIIQQDPPLWLSKMAPASHRHGSPRWRLPQPLQGTATEPTPENGAFS